MPYRGPSRGYDVPGPSRALESALDAIESRRSRATGPELRTDLLEHNDALRERREAGRAELAMTPGVSRGGVADALEPREFEQFGEHYTFDPRGEARAEGEKYAARDEAGERSRFDALSKIPGISPRQAARTVYGRSGVMDDANDQEPMRNALAEYMRAPSRESAARAIQTGASFNQFPDRFAGEEPERTSKVQGPNGEIGLLNMKSGEVEWTGERGVAPRGAANAEVAENARLDRERAVESRFARTQLAGARRQMSSLVGRPLKRSAFVDPQTREADPVAFEEARASRAADSTQIAASIKEADDYVRSLGEPTAAAKGAGLDPARAATATPAVAGPEIPDVDPALIESLKADHAQAIAEIRALKIPDNEKNDRIREANRLFREDVAAAGRKE